MSDKTQLPQNKELKNLTNHPGLISLLVWLISICFYVRSFERTFFLFLFLPLRSFLYCKNFISTLYCKNSTSTLFLFSTSTFYYKNSTLYSFSLLIPQNLFFYPSAVSSTLKESYNYSLLSFLLPQLYLH